MKFKSKKTILFISIITIIAMGFAATKNVSSYSDYPEEFEFGFGFDEGYYGDFDDDGSQDDVRLITELDTNFQGNVYCNLYLDLHLPSGYTFHFLIRGWFYTDGSTMFTITLYNTALESGWYLSEIDGYFYLPNHTVFVYDFIWFDPPTPTSPAPGDPVPEITVN